MKTTRQKNGSVTGTIRSTVTILIVDKEARLYHKGASY